MNQIGLALPALEQTDNGAVISADGLYRYILTRTWDRALPVLVFCMFNPSTADATVNDPTIRKCIGFAKLLGRGGIVVVNLFAYRATKPGTLVRALKQKIDIIGPDNDLWLKHAFSQGRQDPVMAFGGTQIGAWVPLRLSRVYELARQAGARMHALGVNEKSKAGTMPMRTPRHPLYTPYNTPMTEWTP